MAKQATLRKEVSISGIGQHKGMRSSVRLLPAPADSGIMFRIGSPPDAREFPLSVENVFGEAGYTSIGEKGGPHLKTIEHMISAVHGMGIDNLVIETDGFETPILDGSALPLFEKLEEAGLEEQDAPKRAIRVLRHVEFSDEKAVVSLSPAARGLTLDVAIDYPDIGPIGRQHMVVELTRENYRGMIAPARTFARMRDVEYLHSKGLALGASLKTGIAVDGERVLNPEGLRAADEFVAHKVLDAVGDLFAAGLTLIGLYKSEKGGHMENDALMRKLFSDRSNYEVVEA